MPLSKRRNKDRMRQARATTVQPTEFSATQAQPNGNDLPVDVVQPIKEATGLTRRPLKKKSNSRAYTKKAQTR